MAFKRGPHLVSAMGVGTRLSIALVRRSELSLLAQFVAPCVVFRCPAQLRHVEDSYILNEAQQDHYRVTCKHVPLLGL